MRYHRNPPQKSFFAYIIPFLILVILGLIVFMLVRFWDNLGKRINSETSYAYMQTLEGDAKVRLWGSTDWTSVPNSTIKLFKGDSIRALPGSKVKVSLFDKHYLNLSGDSELAINELKKENQTLHTSLTLIQGEAWINVARDINPNSTFLFQTDTFQVETEGVILDVEPNILRIIKGEADVTIQKDGDSISTVKVGVGQELVLTDEKIQNLLENPGNVDVLSMLADEFKLSSWYLFNTEGKNIGNNATGSTVSDDIITDADYENTDVSVAQPIIKVPAGNGEEYKIKGTKQQISGTVKSRVSKVIVNDYTLQSFKEGDTEWKYNADVNFGNLKEGKNEYKVVAIDAEGNESEPTVITLIYGNVKEETETEEANNITETEEEESVSEETGEVTGELKITEPNEGENFETTETHFIISGTAPSNVAKIIVSGYTLQSFEAGSETWKYTADPQYNNITVGEDNTYTVVAYDENDKIIATEELVITVNELTETGTGGIAE